MEVNNSLPSGTILKGISYSYRIEKTLGQGSFGITYLASVKMTGALGAIDANINVAIKEFFMRDINGRSDTTVTSGRKGGIYDDYKRKFTREAVNLSKLQHPNIVKVIESFEANNTVYYVMEYLSGGSLDDYITKNNGMKEDKAIKIVKQIGSALSFMHKNKMLHLDLKPSNIMRNDSGDIVLIDFGLSKQYDTKGEPESSTKVGTGTPGYAPIEQANYREGKDFPVTMDVYALGSTIYKMLTGICPPEASEILNDGFPYGALAQCGVSSSLSNCIEKAMAPLKKDRYQSVYEMIEDIEKSTLEEKVSDESETNVDEIIQEDEEIIACEVPVLYDDKYWGEYEVEIGEPEFGTFQLLKKKVKGHIPIPETIFITKIPCKGHEDLSYEIILKKSGWGKVRITSNSVHSESTINGIPDDVLDFLIRNGYFSPVHWERERTTSEMGKYSVSCVFKYKDGRSFRRSCNTTLMHVILLNSIEKLFETTSLSTYILETVSTRSLFQEKQISENGWNQGHKKEVTNKWDSTTPKKKDDELGLLGLFLYVLGLGAIAIYPFLWLWTLLSDSYRFPDITYLLMTWIGGVIICLWTTSKLMPKKVKGDRIMICVMWLLLTIQTLITIYLNYIIV